MIKKLKLYFFLAITAISLFVFLKKEQHFDTIKKPIILVSISPYDYFTKELVGDLFTIKTYIPSNRDPHSYEPTLKQLQSLRDVDLWFCLNDIFEKQTKNALISNFSKLKIIDLCEHLDLVESTDLCSHSHGHHDHLLKDRHVWLSPRIVSSQISIMKRELIKYFPKYKDIITSNEEKLQKKLSDLDELLKHKLKKIRGEFILVSHPDFTYFCKDYGLNQVPVEYDGKELNIRQIYDLFELAKEKEIKNIIFQPQYHNQGSIVLAKKLSFIKKIYIDPFSYNYFDNLSKFADTIIQTNRDFYEICDKD